MTKWLGERRRLGGSRCEAGVLLKDCNQLDSRGGSGGEFAASLAVEGERGRGRERVGGGGRMIMIRKA